MKLNGDMMRFVIVRHIYTGIIISLSMQMIFISMLSALIILDTTSTDLGINAIDNHLQPFNDNTNFSRRCDGCLLSSLSSFQSTHERSFVNDKFLGPASNDSGTMLMNILPTDSFVQKINETKILHEHSLTSSSNRSTLYVAPNTWLQNITIVEKNPPYLALNMTHLMKDQWHYSEEMSNGIATDDLSLSIMNSSNEDLHSISVVHTMTTPSGNDVTSFFASRSLRYNLASSVSNFSHVTRYPTMLSLNLSLRDLTFRSPTLKNVASDYLFRIGLKFNSSNDLNWSMSGGIFYVVWGWTDLFAPTSTSMLQIYNATIGSEENGPVFYLPKNLSISDSSLFLNINLTRLLWNLSSFNSSDNFDWNGTQLYYDSLSEIFFEWYVYAPNVPANTTFRLQFALEDLILESQIPSTYYTWRALLNDKKVQFSPVSKGKYIFSNLDVQNASRMEICFEVLMINDSNYNYPYIHWEISIQYAIFRQDEVVWNVSPLVNPPLNYSYLMFNFTLSSRIAFDDLSGNLSMSQSVISLSIPSDYIRLKYDVLSSMNETDIIEEITSVNSLVQGINSTHILLRIMVRANDVPLDEFSRYFLTLNFTVPNRMNSISIESNVILKGSTWMMQGYIENYSSKINGKQVSVIIYQNNGSTSPLLVNHSLSVDVASSGFFFVYLSRNYTQILVEGNGFIVLHWNFRWYQGMVLIPITIISRFAPPTPTSLVVMGGRFIHQFDSWKITGSLQVSPSFKNSSSVVNVMLVEDQEFVMLDDVFNHAVDVILNKTFFVTNVADWTLNLGIASLIAGNYSLVTLWTLESGIRYYNVTLVSVLESSISFIIKNLEQPSRTWLSLQASFEYSVANGTIKNLISDAITIILSLNDSHSVIINGLLSSNGTMTVYWYDLPADWKVFQLDWYLSGIQENVANGSIFIFNRFENELDTIIVNGTLEYESLKPDPMLTNDTIRVTFNFFPERTLNFTLLSSQVDFTFEARLPLRLSPDIVNGIMMRIIDPQGLIVMIKPENVTLNHEQSHLRWNWSQAILLTENVTFQVIFYLQFPRSTITHEQDPGQAGIMISQINVKRNIFPFSINLTIIVPFPQELRESSRAISRYRIVILDNLTLDADAVWSKIDLSSQILYVGNFTLNTNESGGIIVYWYMTDTMELNSSEDNFLNSVTDLLLLTSVIILPAILLYYKKRRTRPSDILF